MSSRSYVCVPCRWSRRAKAAYGLNVQLRCPHCQAGLWEMEWRWRIPRKTNEKGWERLAAKIASEAADWIPRRVKAGEIEMARLDRQIGMLESSRKAEEKKEKVKHLKFERSKVEKDYL